MRKLIVIVAMLAGLVVPAASAQATPYLGIGEAKRALGAELHRSFKYGAQRGSMLAFCGRRAWNVVRCDLLFTDLDGDRGAVAPGCERPRAPTG